MPAIDDINSGPDTIRILITTDNHVGYNENDPIRGDDSWKTFEEITSIAKEKDVDMILQGGDLFHINKPSKKSMYNVIKSLRTNCLGDRPCELELLGDPSMALGKDVDTVNYEDPNINISVPVFAISGNHDDATGEGFLLPLDLLSASGLINHFGKVPNNEELAVSPLIFQKGASKLALYGLANVRDERLHRLFRDGNVKFLRPSSQTDEWFNILCVHQNHVPHTRTSYLPEQFLPKFLNFVVWGHEHECIPIPVFNPDTGFDTLQPGSSVATSLCEAEAVEKNIFILNINKSKYSNETIKLKTVRPFIMDEVSLLKERFISGPASKDDISKFLTFKIEELVKKAKQQFFDSNREMFSSNNLEQHENEIPLPLVRLRVEYSGDYEVENPRRFSNKFVGKIANINDVVHFYKKKAFENNDLKNKSKFSDKNIAQNEHGDSKTTELRLQDIMNEFLQQAELNLIPEDGINNAVKKFLENEDKNIMNQYIKNEISQETKMFLDMDIDDETFHDDDQDSKKVFKSLLAQIKRENTPQTEINTWSDNNDLNLRKGKSGGKKHVSEAIIISDSESDPEIDLTKTKKKGPRRKSAARRPKDEIIVSDEYDSGNDPSDIVKSSDDGIASDDSFAAPKRSTLKPEKRSVNATSQRGGRSTRGRTRKSQPKGKSSNEAKLSKQTSESRSLLDDIMSMGS